MATATRPAARWSAMTEFTEPQARRAQLLAAASALLTRRTVRRRALAALRAVVLGRGGPVRP